MTLTTDTADTTNTAMAAPAGPDDATAQSVVVTQGLSKEFGKTVAVDDLDLQVAPGEIFGLVGPDGAGKTTTLRLLTAIMVPSAGSVSVLGFDTVDQAEKIRPHIGYMAQRFNLYRDLTVDENLDFFADVFGVPDDVRGERIQEAVAFAGLEQFRKRRAEHLSGGMQKKLALAVTLVHRPQVLFLDEPTTGVDPVSRREFWEILTDLHLQGITIVVSTPYMDEAERCARVGLMYEGRMIICDTPRAIRGLLGGQMLEVITSDLRTARTVVESLPGVTEVQTYGDRLHVFVDDVNRSEPVIEAGLEAAGIEVRSVRATLPRMEEAFISLIRRQEQAELDEDIEEAEGD
jgi:ABC-2 type transport system ATP-binding protein